MKMGIVIAGVVLLIIGGVLAAIPVPNQSVASGNAAAGTGPVFEFPGPLDIINPSITYTASWTSSSGSSIQVKALDCGTDSSCASPTVISNASGASGSLSWTGTKGHYYGFLVLGAASITVTASLPLTAGLIGFILLIIGILILIVGLVLKRKPKPAPPMPATPTTPDQPAT